MTFEELRALALEYIKLVKDAKTLEHTMYINSMSDDFFHSNGGYHTAKAHLDALHWRCSEIERKIFTLL